MLDGKGRVLRDTRIANRYYIARGEQIVDVWPIMGRSGAAQRRSRTPSLSGHQLLDVDQLGRIIAGVAGVAELVLVVGNRLAQ
jgi:hypothetical protein